MSDVQVLGTFDCSEDFDAQFDETLEQMSRAMATKLFFLLMTRLLIENPDLSMEERKKEFCNAMETIEPRGDALHELRWDNHFNVNFSLLK